MSAEIKFYTLGCKVNQYETQGIREQLLNAGFRENNSETSDIYIINTCTVTAQADRESRRLIRKALYSNPHAKIIATGCLVEKDAQQIRGISDKIHIVPNQQKHNIIGLLKFSNDEPRTTNHETFIPLRISRFYGHERAFVKIQDGCNNFCAYCKVPLVRGKSRSRSLQGIIEEVTRLVSNGFKEIVLSGICLGDYRYRNYDLADVLASLEKIEGEFRIRLSSIEPQLIDDRLINTMADCGKVCPHLHIPLQSGDNAILKKMNRRYAVKDYLSLVARIKKKIKNAGVTTDILVGFPGEKEKNFCNTIRCLKEVLPLRTHIFSFSPRQGTAAFNLPGRLEAQVVKERVDLLKEVVAECSYKFRRGFLGKRFTVLIESQPDRENGFLCGYSENYIRVGVENASKKDINNLLQVRLKTVDKDSTKAWI